MGSVQYSQPKGQYGSSAELPEHQMEQRKSGLMLLKMCSMLFRSEGLIYFPLPISVDSAITKPSAQYASEISKLFIYVPLVWPNL